MFWLHCCSCVRLKFLFWAASLVWMLPYSTAAELCVVVRLTFFRERKPPAACRLMGFVLYTLHSRTSHKGFMWLCLWNVHKRFHFILMFMKVLHSVWRYCYLRRLEHYKGSVCPTLFPRCVVKMPYNLWLLGYTAKRSIWLNCCPDQHRSSSCF